MRGAAVGIAVATMVLSVVPAANAARAVRSDPRGDAPASVDLLRARYVNGNDAVAQHVRVRDLNPGANVYLVIGRGSHPYRYAARVWKRGDGSVAERLYKRRAGEDEAVPCRGVRMRWQPERNKVTVSVPWRCLRMRVGALTMQAQSIRDRDQAANENYDVARRAVVRRG
jgi:hypothetical protein